MSGYRRTFGIPNVGDDVRVVDVREDGTIDANNFVAVSVASLFAGVVVQGSGGVEFTTLCPEGVITRFWFVKEVQLGPIKFENIRSGDIIDIIEDWSPHVIDTHRRQVRSTHFDRSTPYIYTEDGGYYSRFGARGARSFELVERP